MAAPLLLLAAGVALAASSGPKKPAGAFKAIGAAKPTRAPNRATWQATTAEPGYDIVVAETLTTYAGGGESATASLDIPADANYTVVVRAMVPAIGYSIKIRGKRYGRGLGPDGSAKVVEFVSKAISTAGKLAAPAAAKDAQSAAVAAGIKVLTAVVDIYANLI